ncbi:PTS sugar transporter subunit IIB [Marininema halotolerans]|uniref:Phosphotransferase system cellobiose-specific component IIB n=1 Tax=Marininema halotolerans TaxID=1155944 RepID=A0A1I6NSZ7_9BACL|nr:hypothetical protein [Marininema halotolerans]SFS30985.1 Phosphotransferase system cellobiose-specific component IIB [Marininema halotolerans]
MKDERPLRFLLLCLLGTTSQFLAARIQEHATKKGISLIVEASAAIPARHMDTYDLILFSPQVHHLRATWPESGQSPSIPILSIDAKSFALMNGEAILEQALYTLSAS